MLLALPIVMYGKTKWPYLKNESEDQKILYYFLLIIGHELRARVKSSLEMLLTALNIILYYFWSHDFQPIGCVEKCAINHVKHT